MENKTQHTPGPWIYDDGHLFTSDTTREYNSIATLHDIYKNDGTPESNAAIIAAAPDMLEALEDLVHAHNTGMGSSAVQLRIERAKDAINKAKNL